MTVSGAPEKGFDTLVQPVTRVHRKLNTVEETPTTTEFHVTMIPPSWVGMADGYWADVDRTVGEPNEIEAMFPVRSRLRMTGMSRRSAAAGPPSAMIRIVSGEVKTAAGLPYPATGVGDLAAGLQTAAWGGTPSALTTDPLPPASTQTGSQLPNASSSLA